LIQNPENTKSSVLNRFTTTLPLQGKHWHFEVRLYHPRDPRFEGTVKEDDLHATDFVLVKSSIGKWLISGERLPIELKEHAQQIGKALEKTAYDQLPGNATGSAIDDVTTVHMKNDSPSRDEFF
jgi:hypothetical protein